MCFNFGTNYNDISCFTWITNGMLWFQTISLTSFCVQMLTKFRFKNWITFLPLKIILHMSDLIEHSFPLLHTLIFTNISLYSLYFTHITCTSLTIYKCYNIPLPFVECQYAPWLFLISQTYFKILAPNTK